ncbi:MAG: D-alanyl-D-alanine carboxypeptidase [Alphaproteobacteria bacterium]|nr:D-alanyl-D-alanine carboxypeptidase [Alphaproteobacteria bacterium]
MFVVKSAMKLQALVVLCCALLFSSVADAKPQFSAITVDARTGAVLFGESPDGLRMPASLTKMMTLYVLFQDLKAGRINRSTPLRVSVRAASIAPSKLGMKPGSMITVDEAIRALVTKSANDVASTIAENLGGTESNFAARMTRVAHSIGMSRTTFYNASGLPNSKQFTTARDMATLGLRLMRDFPQYYPYFRITEFNFRGRVIRTHNSLVLKYDGTDGIKTGYIAAAGFNLVTSTKHGDKRLVGVVLGARSTAARSAYMIAMLNRSFAKAKDGATVAALAGSAKGAINPLVATTTEQTKPDKTQMAAVAAAAAQDTTATAAETGADTTPVASTSPKVIEATLASSEGTKKPTGKLPFEIKSVSNEPSTLEDTIKKSWNIQIGAFPDKAQAQAKLTALKGKAIASLEGKSAYTIAVQSGANIVYRARFAGFDATTAKQACAKIVSLGEKCMAFQPQS